MIIIFISLFLIIFISLNFNRTYRENFTDLQNKLYLLECKQRCYPENKFFGKKNAKIKEKEFIKTYGKLKNGEGSKIWTSVHSHMQDDQLYSDSYTSDLTNYVNQKSKKLDKWPIITCDRYCKPLEYSKNNITNLERSNPKLFWIKELVSPIGGNHSKYR